MHRMIALVASVGIACGLVGAVAYDQLTSGAGAAPPPPSPQPVREQNLDGSGFIRVHEQGTANVTGTVNVGNLPAVQDVNVVSAPSQGGRLIELGTQTLTIGGGNPPYQSSFVDVSDCEAVTTMARASGGSQVSPLSLQFHASPDGVQAISTVITGASTSNADVEGFETASLHDSKIVTPFLRVEVGVGGSTGATTQVTAWIWCEP